MLLSSRGCPLLTVANGPLMARRVVSLAWPEPLLNRKLVTQWARGRDAARVWHAAVSVT